MMQILYRVTNTLHIKRYARVFPIDLLFFIPFAIFPFQSREVVFLKIGITINGIFFETKIVLHFILRCVQREMNG